MVFMMMGKKVVNECTRHPILSDNLKILGANYPEGYLSLGIVVKESK
jgi:hypothetical protein